MSESNTGNGAGTAEREPQTRPGDGRPGPEAFARSGAEPPTVTPQKRPLFKRPLVLLVVGVVFVAGIVIGLLWYLNARHWESTDDAFVQADVTQVGPRISGYVESVKVTDNQDVSPGQLLVMLDPNDLQAKANEARAAVTAAESTLQQARDNLTVAHSDVGQAQAAERSAQTEADRAHSELARYERLSAAAVTQQQLINLRAAAQSADAQLEAAKKKTISAQARVKFAQSQIDSAAAQVAQAQASEHAAQLQLGYTAISAPIAGTVTNKAVNAGDYVQAGQALLALVPHQVYVIANFKETQLDLMKPGQPVNISIDAYPGHTFHGSVDSIQRGSGSAFSLLPPENATGNYVKVVQRVPVKIAFDAEGFRVGPGMSVVPKVKVR